MRVERATIRLHVKPEEKEEYELLKETLFSLAGFDINEILEKKKLSIEQLKSLQDTKSDYHESTAIGFEERKIIISELVVKTPKLTEILLKKIYSGLNDEDKKLLYLTADTRIDEENKLYIRLDKELLKENKYLLTDSGDCYKITFQIVTYPKSRETAIKDFLDFLETKALSK